MKNIIYIIIYFSLMANVHGEKVNLVTTLSTYADIAQKIGGDKVNAEYIVAGDQDAHFVRPKPSFAVMLNKAELFVSTGLDLELWVPSLVDMSKNEKIRSGGTGFVAAYDGIDLLEKPQVLSRSEGGLHIYGNPHITTNPLNFKIIAQNIAIGLKKIDPQNAEFYDSNLSDFKNEIDKRTFGEYLVNLMGGKILTKLAYSEQLIPFLEKKEYQGKKLITYLGGWLKDGMVFRNKKIVAYHKNWVYYKNLFGIDVIGYVEPKPGIPPSPKHIENLIQEMKKNEVEVILAANYFDENKVRNICEKVGATPIIVPLYVNGTKEVGDVFELVSYWINKLKRAYEK